MSAEHSDTGRVAGQGRRGAMAVADPKTSAAATFALVFGLSSLFTALLALLAPLAVVFGLIGLVLALVGMRKARQPDVTGRGVAIGGLVLSVLGFLLGIALIAGVTVFLNSGGLDQLEQRIQDVRAAIPTEVPDQ